MIWLTPAVEFQWFMVIYYWFCDNTGYIMYYARVQTLESEYGQQCHYLAVGLG